MTGKSKDLSDEGNERLFANYQAVVNLQNLAASLYLSAEITTTEWCSTLDILFNPVYKPITFLKQVINMVHQHVQHSTKIVITNCNKMQGYLTYRNATYVPQHLLLRIWLIQNHHDSLTMSQGGNLKTFELLSPNFYWLTIQKDVSSRETRGGNVDSS